MTTVLLIIHLFVTLALIGVVLIQRSEGGGLGIGSSQGMGAFMGGRGTANLLTRTTAILAAMFMALSMSLALLNRGTGGAGRASILDQAPVTAPASTTPASNTPASTTPASTTPASGSPAPTISAPAGSDAAKPGTPALVPPTSGTQAPAKPSGPGVPTN